MQGHLEPVPGAIIGAYVAQFWCDSPWPVVLHAITPGSGGFFSGHGFLFDECPQIALRRASRDPRHKGGDLFDCGTL